MVNPIILSKHQLQLIDYIGTMAVELQRLSQDNGLDFLGYLFGMIALETLDTELVQAPTRKTG